MIPTAYHLVPHCQEGCGASSICNYGIAITILMMIMDQCFQIWGFDDRKLVNNPPYFDEFKIDFYKLKIKPLSFVNAKQKIGKK
jgi:hypothetical protein